MLAASHPIGRQGRAELSLAQGAPALPVEDQGQFLEGDRAGDRKGPLVRPGPARHAQPDKGAEDQGPLRVWFLLGLPVGSDAAGIAAVEGGGTRRVIGFAAVLAVALLPVVMGWGAGIVVHRSWINLRQEAR